LGLQTTLHRFAKENHIMDAKSQINDLKETAQDTMENLQDAGEDIQNRLATYWEASREKAAACARATDRSIRENPYQAVGIALGLGVVVGLLISRGRSCED
jgi:ElaB/YqjD/DUF883 family membrane-anchored ribosome-binding protein